MTDDQLQPLPIIAPGLYEHYKGGRYKVIEVARHSETLEPMVVYRALYGAFELWVRPASLFIELITIDGVQRPRFKACQAEGN
jgi:hypothetical protein